MIKTSLFADQEREAKLNKLWRCTATAGAHVDFAALGAEVAQAAPRSGLGGSRLRPMGIIGVMHGAYFPIIRNPLVS
ncbi:hypothetical protein HH213_00675 [Duganella dendranthematis]|uniref:Uncharacterized protein n=1 Tax=Duganella dendranthematis TaxID=2728021 RepID=A0ABX6M3L9_9BURK|nr:hypothetical protein [Duganella dendranthematis]QJD88755.1 hypothetical protein HH213_00675 [Duganella dendranthematis]